MNSFVRKLKDRDSVPVHKLLPKHHQLCPGQKESRNLNQNEKDLRWIVNPNPSFLVILLLLTTVPVVAKAANKEEETKDILEKKIVIR